MHCLTMLMMGPIADDMEMRPAMRERHEKLRAVKFREVVEEGAFYGQPHSEPVEEGETDTKLGVGGRRFGSRPGRPRLVWTGSGAMPQGHDSVWGNCCLSQIARSGPDPTPP
jgi:hypothetical protein